MQLAPQPVLSGFVRHSDIAVGFSRRRGSVMLLCIFVIGMVSVMVLGLLKTLSVRAQVAERIHANEQVFYVAEAGLQHAIAELESTPDYSGTISWSSDRTRLPVETLRMEYTVTVANTSNGEKLVTSRGAFGGNSTTLIRTVSGKGSP